MERKKPRASQRPYGPPKPREPRVPKEEHVGRMQAQFTQWGAKLDEVVAAAEEVGAEAKEDVLKHVVDLKAKYQVAQSKLDELRASGSDTWETFKTELERSWKEFEEAFKKPAK